MTAPGPGTTRGPAPPTGDPGRAWIRPAPALDGFGRLAGEIAHEFTNILTIVISKADLLADGLPAGAADLHRDLQDLRRAARRGADLTDRMLSLARRRRLTPEVVDLAGLARDLRPTLEGLLPEGVELRTPSREVPGVFARADAGSLHQILLELVSNARDAMPGGGTVTIDVQRPRPSEAAGGEEDGTVSLVVSDTGEGIAPGIRAHVFEPFFTTRPAARGAGLGLSTVWGLAEQQGGRVSFRSAPGRGTEVRVELPAAPATGRAAFDGRAGGTRAPGAATPPRVLVVEDEETIRQAAKRVLERYGYDVLQAVDGEEALDLLCEADGPKVDLVVTDIIMPRLDGIGLFRAARGKGRDLPFLFMSGYQNEEALQGLGVDPETSFLPKPWSVPELLAAVRRSQPSGVPEPLGRPR